MAVTDKKGLWELASAYMGQSPALAILAPDSPTTPLEKTFTTFYDSVRTNALRALSPEFAMRVAELKLAPTVDYAGQSHVWNERWSYVYAPPADMLRFLRFSGDIPSENRPSPHQQIPLPIAYQEKTATLPSAYILAAGAANTNPIPLYRDFAYGVFIDEGLNKRTVKDRAEGTGSFGFDWQDEATGYVIPGNADLYYNTQSLWSLDFQNIAVAGVYDLTAAPTSLTITFAYGDPYAKTEGLTKNTMHIATEVPDAEAVYIVDVTDPSLWTPEFQDAVAYEMAARAAVIHAKSAKLIQVLERQSAIAMSRAITSLGADDESLEGGGPSRATRSRY